MPPVKALFLDISGVLYENGLPIEGAAAVIDQARRCGLTLRFVTNTATRDRQTIRANLYSMGMVAESEELFTAPTAAKNYLKKHQLRPFCLVHQAIQSEFDELEQQDPSCVLLGDAQEDLNYRSLNRAFQLCHRGMPLIGIGMNKYFSDGETLKLDAGPFIKAIEWAADTKAIIMGKPSREFFAEVVASTPFAANQCLMVGDDVAADVRGAADAGLQACLVKTGKYQPGDEEQLPDGGWVIDSVADLSGLLETLI